MNLKARGLGRGLGALFQDDPSEDNLQTDVQKLPLAQISPNPEQPRRDFDEDALKDLAESIKGQGILQPLIVRPAKSGGDEEDAGLRKYEIVAGERRWRAAHLADLREVPVIVKELNDQEALAVALIENLQRENLNPLEEALAMQKLKDEFSLNQEELAAQLGKSRSAIANALRLLKLPEGAREDLRSGRISAGHARALLSFESAEEQEKARQLILQQRLSVREVEEMAAEAKDKSLAGAEAENRPAPGDQDTLQSGAEGAAEADGRDDAPSGQDAAEDLAQSPGKTRLLALQNRVEAALRLPVRLSGRESKGKLKISYSSREELAALLRLLGVEER